jgi:hypothetical protein
LAHPGTPNLPEPPGKSSLERSNPAEGGASPFDASPSPGRDRTSKPQWWVMPNFSYLADESGDFTFVRVLRAAGHDVTAVAEAAPGAFAVVEPGRTRIGRTP